MLITSGNYLKALRRLRQEYSDLPWYKRWWFSLWSYNLSSGLAALDLNNPTTEQVDELLKASDNAWFFNTIFDLITQFRQSISKLSFSGQPDEIKKEIGARLDTNNLSNLALTSPDVFKLFQPMLDVRKFLLAVVHGEYDEVEAMLIKNTNFLTQKGPVTDYSGRRFFNISGFKYALWALDKHLWSKMLHFLPLNEKGEKIKIALLEQYEELKKNGVTYELNGKIITEQHFDFENTLIKELRIQVNDAANWIKSWAEIDKQWREGVGSAQKLLPMHVVYEYCSDVPFHPLPAFIEQPRLTKQFYNWLNDKYEDWFHLGSRLGDDFAICKGGADNAGFLERADSGGGITPRDLVAMETLCDLRTADFIDLESILIKMVEVCNQQTDLKTCSL
ncbi:MAG: F-box protein [Tatlockia sp.]|nr:F-box protein [Tatlockia sp.]